MKAKVIKTGEIVDVYHEPQHGQVSNIYKESVFVNGRIWQENELEFIEPKEVNLKKEVRKYIQENFTIDKEQLDRFGIEEKDYMYSMDESDMLSMAKHFFELGLKAQKGE